MGFRKGRRTAKTPGGPSASPCHFWYPAREGHFQKFFETLHVAQPRPLSRERLVTQFPGPGLENVLALDPRVPGAWFKGQCARAFAWRDR